MSCDFHSVPMPGHAKTLSYDPSMPPTTGPFTFPKASVTSPAATKARSPRLNTRLDEEPVAAPLGGQALLGAVWAHHRQPGLGPAARSLPTGGRSSGSSTTRGGTGPSGASGSRKAWRPLSMKRAGEV